MLEEVRLLDEIDAIGYQGLWDNLTGITPPELEWRPHPQANSTNWVLGHSVWFEEWVGDALHETGRYLEDEHPTAYRLDGLGEIRERFDRARRRLRDALGSLEEEDLGREVAYFGSPRTIRQVLISHTAHLAGSRYQIRYIRGTYSRAHATDKSVFDPW